MKSSKYHKTANRDVRPFFHAASLEQALDRAQIRLFEDQPFTEETSFVVEETQLAKLAVSVKPNLDGLVGSDAIGLPKLALAVTAFNPFLKRTLLVQHTTLSGKAPNEVAVGPEVMEQLGGGTNVTIEMALYLSTNLQKEAGKPFLRGHWLSKKSFDLRPPKLSEDFDIEPTDDATWRAMGFPPKTLYWVEYYGFANEPANKERPIAKVRIHADVYKKLAADNVTKMGRPIMSFLAAEIACQILAASLSDWKDAEKPEPRSPLSAFLKKVNRVQDATLQQLRGLVEEAGMQKLRAILHADQESVRQVAEA